MSDKFILDAACGGRSFWFNKKHPNTIYIDIRKEKKGFIKDRIGFEVNPDIIMDFRDLEFENKSFKLIFWDPPHIYRDNNKSWMSQKYGSLSPKTWAADIKKGFDECYRVLEDYGVLVFKWSEAQIKLNNVLNIFKRIPLVGHTSGKIGNTKWVTFMKIPGEEKQGRLNE